MTRMLCFGRWLRFSHAGLMDMNGVPLADRHQPPGDEVRAARPIER